MLELACQPELEQDWLGDWMLRVRGCDILVPESLQSLFLSPTIVPEPCCWVCCVDLSVGIWGAP